MGYISGQQTLAPQKIEKRIFLRCIQNILENSKFMLRSLLAVYKLIMYILYSWLFAQILTGEDWNEVMYDGIVSQGGHRYLIIYT
jgi:hypothetical protein